MYKFYVDGSFKGGKTGYGFAIIYSEELVFFGSSEVIDEKFKGSNQIGGEIFAVIKVLEKARELDISEAEIFFDYQGLEKWATGVWKTNIEMTKLYRKIVLESPLKLTWRKVKSHSGNKWNDFVDNLAQNAIPEIKEKKGTKKDLTPEMEVSSKIAYELANYLTDKRITAKYDSNSPYNNYYCRVLVKIGERAGFIDIYNTNKRKPVNPYIGGNLNNSDKKKLEEHFQNFLLKTGESFFS
ncbi:MAG: hypothetical protein IAE91_04640 [Ignavibacteriaceae bacterium]|nr:hypothetical protein [Ignavibacteriaceae bacterium]